MIGPLSVNGNVGIDYSTQHKDFEFDAEVSGDLKVGSADWNLGTVELKGAINSSGLEWLNFSANESITIIGFTLSGSFTGAFSTNPDTVSINATLELYAPSWAIEADQDLGGHWNGDLGSVSVSLKAVVGDPSDSYFGGTLSLPIVGSISFYAYADGTFDVSYPNEWIADELGEHFTSNEGPLAGATVFFDANANGQLDAGEPSTVTATDGSFTNIVPSGSTSGQLVLLGGTDQSTGLTNNLALSPARRLADQSLDDHHQHDDEEPGLRRRHGHFQAR